jgi:CHAT domain-containing protein/tetratricopeptide (TPR) repeat protein
MKRALLVLLAAPAVAAPEPADLARLEGELAAIPAANRPEANARALALAEKLLAAQVKAGGEDRREVIATLLRLADLYDWTEAQDRGHDARARAARIALKVAPTDNNLLTTIGTGCQFNGDLVCADAIFTRLVANVAHEPYLLATNLEQLARVVVSRGDLDRGLALWQREVDELRKQPGAPNLPRALLAVGSVQFQRRDVAAAEATLREGLALADAGVPDYWRGMLAQSLGELLDLSGSRDEARVLRDVALRDYEEAGAVPPTMYVELAQDALARGDFDEANAFAERAHKRGDLVDGDLLLASVALARGDRDRAEVELRAALDANPTVEVLRRLADLYLDLGETARAESLIATAHDAAAPAIAQRNPFALAILRTWSRTAEARNRTADALARYRETFAVSEALLRAVHLGVQEQRLLALLAELDDEHDQVWTLAAAHPHDSAVVELALAEALLRKGRALDELVAAARTARGGGGAALAHLVSLRREYASLVLSGKQADATQLAQLNSQIARVSRAVPGAAADLPGPDRIVAAVRARLGARERLVEIVSYRPFAFANAADRPSRPAHYLAFVVGPRTLTVANLGTVDAIDGLVHDLREQIAHRDRPADAPPLVAAQRALYDAVLGPLELDGVTSVTLALEGGLQVVPFEALRDATGELIERYAFRYVTSGRDLLATPGAAAADTRIVADPAFATTPIRLGDVTLAPPEPLPYTHAEANDIAKLFPGVHKLTGAAATADAVLAGPTPRILHVATHGVFLDDLEPVARGTRGVAVVSTDEPLGAPVVPNPMLRSALLLAGSDDVVTAYRLADARLDGTELVVLSACETGLGERRRNQGVFGLRRALLIAGAETVVSSLWRVSDASTRELMVAYYRRLLAGDGRIAALRTAALAIRCQHPHPFYWAGFVAVGAATPLRSAGATVGGR